VLNAAQPAEFNPNRFALARKRRGFTKIYVARKLGVDLRTITGWERGEYIPSPEMLSAIEGALGFPRAFFAGDDLEEPAPDAASFRSLSRMTAKQRNMALGQGAIALLVNKWLEERFEIPQPSLPDLRYESTPEAAANSLRRIWAIGELPIRNMVHLLEANGVRVFSLDLESREVDAFSMWKANTPFIFLNRYKSSEHSRFDAAHELGHLIMHRHGSPQGREAEREADQFASAFLMPSQSVLAHAPRHASIEELLRLKKIWSVSLSALNYRLHELRLTSDWQHRILYMQIAKRGFLTSEPDSCPRESSLVLQNLFLHLYQQEGISRAKIAEDLQIPISELEHLVFGLVMTSIRGGNRRTERKPVSGLNRIK